MSDSFDPYGPGDAHGPDHRPPSMFEGAAAKGILIVAVAVVIGIVLMPSATRAPLAHTSNTASNTGPTAAPSGQSSGSSSGTSSTTTTTTTVPAPATVHVLVANGTTVRGAAGNVTSYLGTKGYSTLSAVNSTSPATSSAVYATGGSVPAATEVAAALGLPPTAVSSATPPVASTAGATVVVVVGTALAERFSSPSSATTTTTAATTTTTTASTTTTTSASGH